MGSPAQPAPEDWRRARRAGAAAERRRRRAMAIDLLAAAGLAAIVLIVLPGLGVVAWFALPLLVLVLAWVGAERLVVRRRRR